MTTTQSTVTYYAVSIFSSRTIWFNAATLLLAVLSLPEVAGLIPLKYLPMEAALVAMVNLWLRQGTVRPVVFSAPGTTTPVQVKRLDPPAPPVITD